LTHTQRLEGIYNAYNPGQQCRFKHFFYNVLQNPEEAKRYLENRPANFDPVLWSQALKSNPDPSRFVPVQVVGFSDLKARIVEQDKMALAQERTLQDAGKLLDHTKQRHEVHTLAKLEQYKRRQFELAARFLKVFSTISILEAKGCSLSPGEEVFIQKLEALSKELSRPGFKGKLTELSAMARTYDRNEAIESVNDESLERIFLFLEQQQAGLQHLTTLVQKDQKDFEIISKNLSKMANLS